MFDIGWSEILVIAVATLIVVGPKDLHIVLRTIGKYAGILKRQAAEFREHFDDAMRESEFDQIRQDVESIKSDFESSVRDTTESVKTEFSDMQKTMNDTATDATTPLVAGPLSINELNQMTDSHNSEVTQTAALEAEESLEARDSARDDGDVPEKVADASEKTLENTSEDAKKTAGV